MILNVQLTVPIEVTEEQFEAIVGGSRNFSVHSEIKKAKETLKELLKGRDYDEAYISSDEFIYHIEDDLCKDVEDYIDDSFDSIIPLEICNY